MNTKAIYVNLPINDVQKTREFWTKLGFTFNEQYSDDKALCLVLKENVIHVMLLQRDYFASFIDRPVTAPGSAQVINAIEVDDRADVDRLVKLAVENGGVHYKEAQDHGWMYIDRFADIDGLLWEITAMDPSKMPAKA